MSQLSSPIVAPLASRLGPNHFPASRSGLIGRAHAEHAPDWLMSLLRDLPPDGRYYQDVDQVVSVLTTATPHPVRRPRVRSVHTH